MRRFLTRLPASAALLFLLGCFDDDVTIIDFAGGGTPSSQTFDWFVDAATGNDLNPGTSEAPFKTITHALQQVVLGDWIKVRPGTYNAANGEVFPLRVRGGVRLIGDESNKGNGATQTLIAGDGPGPDSNQTVTVFVDGPLAVGAEAIIAGFRITNTGAAGTRAALLVGTGTTSLILLRDCSFLGSPDIAILMRDGSGNCTIRDNIIQSNGTGIRFQDGGFGTRVERNIIRDNTVGLSFACPTMIAGSWDIGSNAGSVGANQLASNTQNDILMNGTTGGGYSVSARNNFWDHVAPSGNDTFIAAGPWTIDTTGAALAPNPDP